MVHISILYHAFIIIWDIHNSVESSSSMSPEIILEVLISLNSFRRHNTALSLKNISS